MFTDREDAGRRLGEKLRNIEIHDPLVLAIPRGGVVTGVALAREIGAELDVVLARKLRAPQQPELAVGAIGEKGEIYLNRAVQQAAGVADEYLEHERNRQMQEIEDRRQRFRAVRPPAPMIGRSVILTDDGIATGSTMMAAIEVARAHDPHEVIVAVPVCAPQRVAAIRRASDQLICLHAPDAFWAVGQFYDSFDPVEDEEVIELLRRAAREGQTQS